MTTTDRFDDHVRRERAGLLAFVRSRLADPDLADRLGITKNNLKVRRHRAHRQLRERVEQTCRSCAAHGCVDCTCRLPEHPTPPSP